MSVCYTFLIHFYNDLQHEPGTIAVYMKWQYPGNYSQEQILQTWNTTPKTLEARENGYCITDTLENVYITNFCQ